MRLIDADALKAYIDAQKGRPFIGCTIGEALKILVDEQPTIEPERKKGKWILHPEQKNIYGGKCVECSECGEKYIVQYIEDEKFCRNCGADMRGDSDE